MNLIDLRKYQFQIDKIILFDDSKCIFQNIEFEQGIYKAYFYTYSLVDKTVRIINKNGIETNEDTSYSNCILNEYIYTNSAKGDADDKEISIYRINIEDGEIEELYSTKKDVVVNILNDRYILLSGNNYKIDEEHSDIQKEYRGEYDYAILCDTKDKKEYKIKDKKLVLGIRDYCISYSVDESRYMIFEEAYMEDWELEDYFERGVKKEEFYINSYMESINIISVDRLAEAIKAGDNTIPFNVIHKTELNACTRYFGMDDKNIYYRVKNFKTKIEDIFSVNKRTLKKMLLKTIKMDSNQSYNIHHDIKNRQIYKQKIIHGNKTSVIEIYNNSFSTELDDEKESFQGIIDDYIITEYWTEDDNGYNLKNFVKVKNIKNGAVNIYEGVCTIIKDNLVLFK